MEKMQNEPRIHFVLEASISPSEDPEKVAAAIRTIAPNAGDVQISGRKASLRSESTTGLLYLMEQLRDRHIRTAARRSMVLARQGKTTTILFNRQAAAAGVIALCGNPRESPLGPIVLIVESDELDHLMDWLSGPSPG